MKTNLWLPGFAVGLGILAQAWAADPASLPRDDFWVPNGEVKAIVETNGIVYIGGVFDYISPVSATGSALDLFSGAEAPDFPKFNGAIKAVQADGFGGWFIGGLFTSVGGVSITNLAHIRADQSADPDWRPNPDNAVLALAGTGSRLYVGGSFGWIGGMARTNLAALDPVTGAVLPGWKADATTFSLKPGSVNALALSDGLLYVGGFFSYINGALREHVASVDATTGAVTPWYPNVYSGGQSMARVDALAIGQNILYVGGTFRAIGANVTNQPVRNFLAALDTTQNGTNSMTSWDPSASGPVTCLAVSCDAVYVGGSFTNIGGQPRNYLAALDRTSGLAAAWNPNADNDVLVLGLAGHTVYAGGKFTRIGGQARNFLAALDLGSGQATPWNPQADFGVAGLAIAGQTAVAGGSLGAGGKMRKNVAAFDARTGQPLDWQLQMTGVTIISGYPYTGVYALAATSNTVYLGGPFTAVDGQPRNHLAAMDVQTGLLSAWNPNANGIVEALAVSGSIIYAGGSFTTNGGARRSRLAALDAVTGTALSTWNPSANDKVSALACQSSLVYAGGRFTQVAGQLRNRLAALDATGAATAWNPNLNDQVSAITISGQTSYLGGQFTLVGGQPRNKLAAVDLSTQAVLPWDVNVRFLTPAGERSAAVNALCASGQAVYVGGSFTYAAGQPRQNLAAIGPAGPATATAWDPNADASVNALVVSGNHVYAGGLFQNVGGQYRPCLAVFPPMGSPVITSQPRSLRLREGETASFSAEASGEEPLFYQWQLNGTNLPGATSPTYLLPSVKLADSGRYTLVVTNALGLMHSQPAALTVLEPPAILIQPIGQVAATGQDVTLSVVASGSPSPTYQWLLNGVRIPGAVYPSLTLTNVQPTNGGSYSVVVANLAGALISQTATLLVPSTDLGLRDNLSDRVKTSAAYGVGSGSNLGATREPGEPHHAGKPGGRSVWLGWIAPFNGIATFSTRGSDFDTLLGVYANTNLDNPNFGVIDLGEVASDEDRGGFLTSQASFYATAGTEYLIAVDGHAGAAGNIVLSWSLDLSAEPFPRILTPPLSRSVAVGQDATFLVTIHSDTPERYQWFFGCAAIAGATNASLTITNVQARDVGDYRVWVMNASSQAAISQDASLEIGPEPNFVSQAKVEDLFPELLTAPLPVPLKNGPRLGLLTQGYISVPLGSVTNQTINNADGQTGAPLCCGKFGGAAKWVCLRPESDGVLVIDTAGSKDPSGLNPMVPLLAAYYSTNLSNFCSALVVCTNDGRPVRFAAQGGTYYLVVVDGLNGEKGTIALNWKFGQPPSGPSGPPPDPVPGGAGPLTLQTTITNGVPPPAYQWFTNGVMIPGATSRTWVVRAFSSPVDTYSVVASNYAGSVTQTMAVLVRLEGELRSGDGVIRLSVPSALTLPAVLEDSSNLVNWVSNQVIDSVKSRSVDIPMNNKTNRFFRLRSAP